MSVKSDTENRLDIERSDEVKLYQNIILYQSQDISSITARKHIGMVLDQSENRREN